MELPLGKETYDVCSADNKALRVNLSLICFLSFPLDRSILEKQVAPVAEIYLYLKFIHIISLDKVQHASTFWSRLKMTLHFRLK